MLAGDGVCEEEGEWRDSTSELRERRRRMRGEGGMEVHAERREGLA
jgi:hypothetical protein